MNSGMVEHTRLGKEDIKNTEEFSPPERWVLLISFNVFHWTNSIGIIGLNRLNIEISTFLVGVPLFSYLLLLKGEGDTGVRPHWRVPNKVKSPSLRPFYSLFRIAWNYDIKNPLGIEFFVSSWKVRPLSLFALPLNSIGIMCAMYRHLEKCFYI